MDNYHDQNNPGKKGFGTFIGYLALGILGILLGAAIIYGLFMFFFAPVTETTIEPEIIEDEVEEDDLSVIERNENSLADVAEQALDAVVGVNKHVYITRFGEQSLEEIESGSGVIIEENGYIVTNQHVIEGANKITVVIPGKGSYEAELVGSDAMTDLALLKIGVSDLVALSIGDSDLLRVGEKVLAIGNPFGYFQQTVTAGIISAVGRQVRMPGSDYVYTFLQTDALVNPGNSGGPLLNLNAEIIGINTAKIALVGVEGIGLAVPSNTVKRVINDLYEHGRVIRPHLGVIIDDWLQYGEVEPERGVIIVDIASGSAADEAGLQVGDIIVSIDNNDVYYLAQLFDNLFSYYPGDTVTIAYYRNGVREEVVITLGERPDNLPAQVEVDEEPETDEDTEPVEDNGDLEDIEETDESEVTGEPEDADM
jgi:serine protease Do